MCHTAKLDIQLIPTLNQCCPHFCGGDNLYHFRTKELNILENQAILIDNPIRYFKGLIYSSVNLNALTEMVWLLRYVKITRGFLMALHGT